MSIPFTSIIQNADQSWTFTWADAGASSYRVVLQGVLVSTVSIPSYTWTGGGFKTFPPPLEIVLSNQQALSEEFLPYFYIQWSGEPSASYYLIQQYVGSVWQMLANVTESGQWLYTYRTSILLDEAPYLFQVIAVDAFGDSATPRQYQRYVVCPPMPVDVSIDIGYAAGDITITSAS